MSEELQTAEQQIVETVKKKRNPAIQKRINTEPGDNAKYLRHALGGYDLPPIDLDSDEQVEERIYWYFNHCAEDDMKPTLKGLANALGIAKETLYDWRTGYRRNKTDNRKQIINKAYDVLEELWEDYMLNGKINPVSGIFIAKNQFGYTDKQEVVLTPNNPLDNTEDPDTVSKRYLESIDETE